MATFRRTVNLDGKFKELRVNNGEFVDYETGEILNLAEILSDIYGDSVFSLSTSQKQSEDLGE